MCEREAQKKKRLAKTKNTNEDKLGKLSAISDMSFVADRNEIASGGKIAIL